MNNADSMNPTLELITECTYKIPTYAEIFGYE